MKLDMGAAWNTATSLIGRNRDVVLVIAGVFFFLPSLAVGLALPQADALASSAASDDPQALMNAMMGFYADYWWALLLTFIFQGVGTLALLTLLTDRARPTVGEAIKRGAISFPSYFVTNILAAIAVAGVVMLPLALVGMSGSAATAAIAAILLLPVMVYLMVKFSLIMPAIAIDGILNPLAALRRSWQLTRGNSFRLLLFYFLLLVATTVILALVSMVVGVIFAAMGGEIEKLGNAIFSSLINAAFVVVFFGVLAGVHRQLAGEAPEALTELFE
ncbi:MAG: glycerophosphoryl diester phosphodiesterase membrane domain-containing protein [Erythrobacter sp.]